MSAWRRDYNRCARARFDGGVKNKAVEVRASRKHRRTCEKPMEAEATSTASQLNLKFPESCQPGSVTTSVVFQGTGHLESDMQLSSLNACDRFTGNEARYLRIVLHQFEDVDVTMSELHELMKEMADLDALATDVMKN